ncbi:hypothetical protein ACS0TY_033823 [Phlomoides rotata]
MKSGYWDALRLEEQSMVIVLLEKSGQQCGTCKVLHDILPTSLNLTCHFVDVDPLCKHCGTEVECAAHALRDCGGIHDFWGSTMFARHLSDAPVCEWVRRLLLELPLEDGDPPYPISGSFEGEWWAPEGPAQV